MLDELAREASVGDGSSPQCACGLQSHEVAATRISTRRVGTSDATADGWVSARSSLSSRSAQTVQTFVPPPKRLEGTSRPSEGLVGKVKQEP